MISRSIYAKLELLNLGGSHKVRAARQMIIDAEREGRLSRGATIIEKTGGNLGIGLAIEANRRGYPLHLVVNPDFSELKKKILLGYGAKLVGINHLKRGCSTTETVGKVVDEGRRGGLNYVFLDQFSNPSNLRAHELTTGPEMVNFANQVVTSSSDQIVLVGGIGTGASLTGVGRAIKSSFPSARVVAVQPHGVDFERGEYSAHEIQGTGVAHPPLMDFSLVDRFVTCSYDDVLRAQRWLVATQGIFCGLSSAANVHVARQVEYEFYRSGNTEHRLIVLMLLYDGGESYLK